MSRASASWSSPAGLWSRVGEWCAAALFVTYSLILLCHHSAPALGDYGDWTYEGILLRNHILGITDSAHLLKHYPVPNSIGTVGIALFALVFSWQIAAKLWLCVILATCFFSMRHMLRTCGGSAALWLVVPTAVFLNTNFWYGFTNFDLGLCWVVLMASLLLRDEGREWIFGLLLVVAFFTHMIPFLFAGLLLIIYVAQSGRGRLLWQLVPGGVLTLWYLAGRFLQMANADGQAGMISSVRTYSAAFWAYKGNSYLKSFGFINPGDTIGSVSVGVLGPKIFLILQLANLILSLVIAWCLVRSALSAYRNKRPERFVFTAALISFPIYLLLPGTAAGISDPGSRVLQTLLAVAIFLCATSEFPQKIAMRLGAVSALAMALASAWLFNAVVFTSQKEAVAVVPGLPHALVVLAHVPTHSKFYYYLALERQNMKLSVFPTAMFVNTQDATDPLN
jgi:hypothetical protein